MRCAWATRPRPPYGRSPPRAPAPLDSLGATAPNPCLVPDLRPGPSHEPVLASILSTLHDGRHEPTHPTTWVAKGAYLCSIWSLKLGMNFSQNRAVALGRYLACWTKKLKHSFRPFNGLQLMNAYSRRGPRILMISAIVVYVLGFFRSFPTTSPVFLSAEVN